MPYYPQYQNPYIYQAPQQSIIWISGEREALAYPVAPNNAVTLWSQSEPVVYLKQADASGRPSLKVYDLVERAEKTGEATKSEYATKSDLAGVLAALEAIRGEMETMQGDIYGIAGKRKMKEEETE